MYREGAQGLVPWHGTGTGTSTGMAGVGFASLRASSCSGAICSAAAVSDSQRVWGDNGGGPSVMCQRWHLQWGCG